MVIKKLLSFRRDTKRELKLVIPNLSELKHCGLMDLNTITIEKDNYR